jgi:hypothetical protein
MAPNECGDKVSYLAASFAVTGASRAAAPLVPALGALARHLLRGRDDHAAYRGAL